VISRIAPARLPEIAAKDTANYEVLRQIVRAVNQILTVLNVRVDDADAAIADVDTVLGDLTDESFVVLTVTADTPNARALTVDSTIIKTDGGAGTTVTLSRAALTGDVTTSANATTIQPGVVSYAKMQDVSAASRLLGRGSAAGSGDVEELTVGSGLLLSGTVLSASGGSGIDAGISAGLNFWGAW